MKKLLFIPLIMLVGCSYTHYVTPNSGAQLTNARFFWTTSELNVSISTNGTATLSTGASKADSEGLGMLVGTAIKYSGH